MSPAVPARTATTETYGGYFLEPEQVTRGSFLTRTESSAYGPGWLLFQQPTSIVVAWLLDEVAPLLDRVQRAGYAAGYLSFEAAPAFEPAARVRRSEGPLAEFALYDQPPQLYKELAPQSAQTAKWESQITFQEYNEGFQKIKERLQAGDTYQINYTFPLAAAVEDLKRMFFTLASAELPPYACYFATENAEIASLSPELFFQRSFDRITCRPMKGTAKPAGDKKEDAAKSDELRTSEKERAENLMIVDMIRNDLGRVAETGTVKTTELFHIERYPSVIQMTSTIEARTKRNLLEVVAALFPCASVVGAPKIAALNIIEEIESGPRGIYTGMLGFRMPGEMQFSVAIRTAVKLKDTQKARYFVGSGVVWDSQAESEWQECLLKAETLKGAAHVWSLLETLRWDRNGGFSFLREHLERLQASAQTLGVPYNREQTEEALLSKAEDWQGEHMRVRLLLDRAGQVTVEASPLANAFSSHPGEHEPFSAALAHHYVNPQDPGLRIKTIARWLYERELASRPEVDEVVLWNLAGEATEFCFGNLVVQSGAHFLTPPLSSGLLPGVFRAQLLERGAIREEPIPLEKLREADAIWHINSVRGWTPVKLL